jgi:hypothetical protein
MRVVYFCGSMVALLENQENSDACESGETPFLSFAEFCNFTFVFIELLDCDRQIYFWTL